jgi:hypothetical protein
MNLRGVRATFAEPDLLAHVAPQFITHPYFGDLGLDIIVPLGVPVLRDVA